MRVIDKDRNAVGDVVADRILDARECRFGDFGAKFGDVLAPLIKVDVEMRRLDVLPLEFTVLDLILAEHSLLRRSGDYQSQKEDRCEDKLELHIVIKTCC